MKKITVATVAILCGLAVHAAGWNWNIHTDWATADEADEMTTLGGYLVYGYDANAVTYSDIIKGLSNQSTLNATLALALGSGAIDGSDESNGVLDLGGTGNLTDDGKSPAYADMFMVILDSETVAGAKNFYAYNEFSPVEITDAVTGDKANFSLGDAFYTGTVGSDGWTKIESVPEPTSGLLLLLGVAGLALRRRRA